MIKTELPLNVLEPLKMSEFLEILQACFYELRATLLVFCREYEVAEGDFPYSPDRSKAKLLDGSTERTLEGIYVLAMDIIGSTDSKQTNNMKDYIIETFKKFQSKGLYFETTGNDAHLCCCYDVAVLWDIAKLIRIQGDMLKKEGDKFKGTRKGLSFGTVRLIEDNEGGTRITDEERPHLLPRAFGITEGVDEHVKDIEERNSAIVIEESTAKRCSDNLRLNLSDEGPFWVRSKHFYGLCYCRTL